MEINRITITIGHPRYDAVEIRLFPRSQRAEVRSFFPSGEQQGETTRASIGDLVALCEQMRAAAP